MNVALFRKTKVRQTRSQQQLLTASRNHRPAAPDNSLTGPLLHQTYAIPLAQETIGILSPVLRALTDAPVDIDPCTRLLYTIGIWHEGGDRIYRCCFYQPELSSATYTVSRDSANEIRTAAAATAEELPGAVPCIPRGRQLSGRMAPYVIDCSNTSGRWTFANLAKSYLLFVLTEPHGARVLRISHQSMSLPKPYFPSYSICVMDAATTSYKITARPDSSANMNSPNKNTCMKVHADGSFKLQGALEIDTLKANKEYHKINVDSVSCYYS